MSPPDADYLLAKAFYFHGRTREAGELLEVLVRKLPSWRKGRIYLAAALAAGTAWLKTLQQGGRFADKRAAGKAPKANLKAVATLGRYLEQLAWPAVESEPLSDHERQMQAGAAFHRLVQRFLGFVTVTAMNIGVILQHDHAEPAA